MQTNGASAAEASSAGVDGNDQLPDHITGAQSLASNGPSVGQSQQQRSSESPGHHHSQTSTQPIITNPMTNPGTATSQSTGSHVPHQLSASHQFAAGNNPGSYRSRHGQSYHNQQRMQQYHHQHQQNKYTKGDSESNLNHVLLITVINPHYPITCDLIHQICGLYGKVNRIVIFKRNGVQAMVEFDNLESAKRAKSMLNGCDIYSGCCTLRVEYAKPTRLNVHKNDNESFDYTNPNLGNGSGGGSETGSGHDQHHHHHSHHLQSNMHHQNHHGSSHHSSRAAGGGNRRGGDTIGNDGPNGSSNHNPYHHSPQSHMPNNPHLKQPVPPTSVGQHSSGPNAYGMVQSTMDQTGPVDSFHQDGGFNVSRGGPPSNYVGVDPFMQSHRSTHGIHGNVYSRQDGHPTQHQHHQAHHHQPRGGIATSGGDPNHHHHHHHHHNSFQPANALMAGHPNMAPQGTVMMVYGLCTHRVNCDRLFNLFCLYGNVVRIKFLRTKEGCAMVQMGDVIAVERCITSLNKITIFGNELQISYSKQAFLHDVLQPFLLPDGSPSFKDFMGNKNNRFKNPEVASKNRILPPSPILHFFNAPFGITEDELLNLFEQNTGYEPVSLKLFLPKAETTKSFSGLVTFRDPAEATEALILCNHLSMPKAGAPHPYILRLCFSPPSYARSQASQAQATQQSQNFVPPGP